VFVTVTTALRDLPREKEGLRRDLHQHHEMAPADLLVCESFLMAVPQ
jgi:hypothetical protein